MASEEGLQKVCIITGSNTGIGYNAAVKLLQNLNFEVILACRTPEKGEAAVESMRQELPNAKVSFMQLDLASLKSVRKFADDFHATGKPLHVLCDNGGFGNSNDDQAAKTEDGFELHMGTNHLGHFLLTMLLLGDLKKSATETGEARIVVTTSSLHDPKTGRGPAPTIDFDNLMLEKEGTYKGLFAYSTSKLANVLFTKELARRLEGTCVTVNCLCPGFIPLTGSMRHASAFT
ncbi:retinol dehydrogenase 12-like [Amphiura filiformis]|uniref:retinol dehydrogenase 12-like n=1 Tax=Amphiura filiformis TaxID=82378 RepID=UPI003B221612